MNKLHILGLSAVLTLASVSALAHGDKSRVGIELESPSVVSAGPQSIVFDLIDNKDKSVLADKDLALMHEKKVHFFMFDAALKEFQHIHPEFDGKVWKVVAELPVNGEYFVWAQGQLSGDGTDFATFNQITVKDGTPANATPADLKEVRTGSDKESKVTLSKDKLVAGKESMLMVKFTHTDSSAPAITPWLGEMAHLIAVSSDGDALIHTHTMETSKPNELMAHAIFAEAGNYRIWVQYMDANVLRTVPLAVKVVSK